MKAAFRELVLAIPSGGVPVAAEIAKALSLPLDAVPVSKVLLPWNTESGYGAVAFDGSVWIDEEARARWNLTQAQIDEGIAQARAKVERRNARLLWSDVDEDDAAAPLGL